jgi:predicted TIM-barrel fold metal-dependent hydrolase
MKNYKNHKSLSLLILLVLFQNCSQQTNPEEERGTPEPAYYTEDDFFTVEKFDSHNHFNHLDTAYINQAENDNFRLLNITDDRPFGLPMVDQQKIAVQLVEDFSPRITYATTFSVKNWDSEEWQEETLSDLKDSFSKGAVAVKVWKNIGMDLKDENGNFVMISHPKFDPILDYLENNNIPLIGHLGEPRDCWLPLEEMTIKGNQNYYSRHPEYHMYKHPEFPSYEDQIQARDQMLERHPDLKFIGAHLGSLEWSLEELADRLDKFPNMAVDLARMSNLQHHAMTDWQKTHDFFIQYQDRLIYATDSAIGETENSSEMKKNVHESRMRDWKFFTTDGMMSSSGFDGEFRGLKLPREVVDKIYRENAEKWILSD